MKGGAVMGVKLGPHELSGFMDAVGELSVSGLPVRSGLPLDEGKMAERFRLAFKAGVEAARAGQARREPYGPEGDGTDPCWQWGYDSVIRPQPELLS
jgi:hypothetical protein